MEDSAHFYFKQEKAGGINMKTIGHHLIIDAFDCDAAILNDVDHIKNLLIDLVQSLGMVMISSHFHQFEPEGLTGILLLSTSHISIHTWPEENFAALDIFTCGDHDPVTQVENILKGLSSKYSVVYNLTRFDRKARVPLMYEQHSPKLPPDHDNRNSKSTDVEKHTTIQPLHEHGDLYDYIGLKELLAARHPVLFQGMSQYQNIHIIDAKDIRMYLNQQLQFSSLDERLYHEAIVHPAFLYTPSHRRVLILGGGDGLALREVLKYPDASHVDLVDIDPLVLHAARTVPELVALNERSFFDKRVNVHTQDARKFLTEPHQPYDVIIADFPDPSNEALSQLYTKEFFQLISKSLAPDGIMVCQSFSPEDAPTVFWSIGLTLESAGLKTRGYHVTVPSFGNWGFHLAGHQHIIQRTTSIPVENRTLPADIPSIFVFPEKILKKQKAAMVNSLNQLILHKFYRKEYEYLS
ncbi:adenosylmethionine decarboxylase [Polycladomyces sp. WAk]|uniref:S-adenosylmethionine decarboxylase proenzyme n=1 Tax=Polycladomyces zharkentensis TaxID=2807616 RepID=A0ABS2WMZ3_9BACL|nr:adenosylmethionine decarboxylase [Polycladomyces sp. WAk]MBN2910891.1 adenosylmethionine decarboxylase [Polycladomyces sp. WAk]